MTISFRSEVQGLLRERLLDAAYEMIEVSGWSSVTMAKLASAVGVSRQTVHTEVGTRHGLAEALALRELGRFLELVRGQMATEADVVEGIRAACRGVLEMGESSVIVRTVFGTVTSENDADFLTILTTESGEIVEAACMVVTESVRELYPPLPLTGDELYVAAEAIVRLVLSALTRPSKPPAEAADDIAWVIDLALTGAAARTRAAR
ncbi:MAG: TetR/AcrR family transcriptional regulator [Aeromicrobium sp.]